jgi:hypothetical protein
MWAFCDMWGRRTKENIGGWLIHLRLLGVGHWGMQDSHGEGCDEWKKMYVLGCDFNVK